MATVVQPSWLPFHFQRSIPLLFPLFKSDCAEITCLVKTDSSYLLTTLISRLSVASFEPGLFRPSHQFYGHEGLKNRFTIKAICFFCVLKHKISKISLFLAINGWNMYPLLYIHSAWPAKVVSPIWPPLASFFDMRSSIQSSIEISDDDVLSWVNH